MKRSYQSVHPVCNERSAAGKKERTRGPRFTGRKRKAILSLDCRTLEHIYLQWYLCSLEPISFVHYVVCIFISSVHCTFCCVYINFRSSVLLKLLYIGISSAYVVKIIFVVHLLCVAIPSVYTRILFFFVAHHSICTQDGLYQILWFMCIYVWYLMAFMFGLLSSPYKEMYFGCVHVLVV